MELVPAWTRAGAWSLGRDPLGMQATSVRLYRKLLPGLTNVTNRLRYYSFYSWVVREFGRLHHSTVEHKWRLFIRRAEALYALACFAVDPARSDGLGGGRWALRESNSLPAIFDLRPHTDRPGEEGQYLKAVRGNFGQFYIASMEEVGLLRLGGRIPIVDRFGMGMADAFASSIGRFGPLMLAAVEGGRISDAGLVEIGRAIHPARIPAGSEEMTQLRRYLCDDESVAGCVARRTSASLVLDLLDKGVSPGDEAAFRRAFYNRAIGDGDVPYPVEGETIERWRAYQANELGHLCLEVLLNEVTSRLSAVGAAEPRQLIETLLIRPLQQIGAESASWSDWALAAAARCEGAEEEIAAPLLAALKAEPWKGGTDVVAAAIRLLATLWGRWACGDGKVRREIAAAAGEHGRSLAGVLNSLDDLSDRPVAEALAVAARRHVISGHLAVAGRKLAASGNFTYHFRSEDGLLSHGRTAAYGYTNPRLGNLIRFLEDGGYHERGSLTACGKRLLRDHQPV